MSAVHASAVGLVVAILVFAGACHRSPDAGATPERAYVPGQLLRALGEPPLGELTVQPTNHVYRFIGDRTFHEPFCIVLRVGTDRTGDLTMKMLSGKGGYDLGQMKERRRAALTAEQVGSFLALLQREDFWHLAPDEPARAVGFDGSEWFIEAVRTNDYHMVGRLSPQEDASVKRIGRRLIELADWKIENLY